MSVPTASSDAFLGERSATFDATVVVSRSLGAIEVAGNVGYLARKNVRLANRTFADEISLKLGGGYNFAHGGSGLPLRLGLAVSIATLAGSPFDSSTTSPVEVLGGGTYAVNDSLAGFGALGAGIVQGIGAPAWRALVGVRYRSARNDETGPLVTDRDEDGIADSQDKCPDSKEDVDGHDDMDGCPDLDNDGDNINDSVDKCPNKPETKNKYRDEDGCPDTHPDPDGDGIVGAADKCPDKPEDVDKFEDDDGCPDDDNDKDGVADAVDKCPLQAENVNGIDDEDGCPDKLPIDPQTLMPPPIEFAKSKAVLLRSSASMLSVVAKVMNTHKNVTLLEVQGHASSEGSEQFNQTLSQKRAEAVMNALVARSVARSRLRAKGYGASRAAASNDTEDNRKRNRRVQFVVIKRN